MRIGIIGCGALGLVHAQRLSAVPGVEVVALSDPSEAAIDRVASVLPSRPERRGTNHQGVLTARVDAVCIASPDAYHVRQVIESFEAGLHVLCEKPLTPYLEELEAVITARDRAGKQIAMTYPRRYDASVRRLRDEIRSGNWGAVTTITAYNAEDWITPNRGTWRHDPETTPGGFFYDASGHQLDTAFWVTGLAGREVSAQTDNCGNPVPLKAWGNAELSNGAPFIFAFVGDAHLWREQINIHCERGDFALLNAKAYRIAAHDETPGTDTRLSALDRRLISLASPEDDETADECFVRMIREGGPNWSPLEDIRPVVTFTRAALESAAHSGSVVSIKT